MGECITGRRFDKRLSGAMFLMATSAICPGFITQTTQFTAQLGAAFVSAIMGSILIDGAQRLNVRPVIGGLRLRAQELDKRAASGRAVCHRPVVTLSPPG